MDKNNIQISFVGENSSEVTGSCIHIKTPNIQILLECGLWQSTGDVLDSFRANNQKFEFKAKDINYVFIGHCHIDHSGRLPLLYKRGSNARTVVPSGNKKILNLLLSDSANIAACDAKTLSLRFNRNYEPLYDNNDVNHAMDCVEEYPFNEKIELDEYVSFRFVSSGHILNSAQIELWITEGGVTKKILYTSDLGNIHLKNSYTSEFSAVEKADIVIGESTYGGESRIASQKIRNKDLQKMEAIIRNTCCEKGGRVLIPVFANQRSQQILTALYDMFHDDNSFCVPILFDTPLGIRINNAFKNTLTGEDANKWEKVSSWNGVIYTEEPGESKAWMKSRGPAIILSSSGFLTNGRSRAWTEALLSNPNNTILFCGFSVENSLASIIKSGTRKKIKFHGKMIPNKCKVVDLHSFSSHMQQDSLADYYGSIKSQRVFLVHGEKESKKVLANLIKKRLSENNLSSKVISTEKNMQYNF